MISGCSSGGKSTLLAELARRGFATVEEPGRRLVTEELAGDGAALPWVDIEAFSRRNVAMAIADFEAAKALAGQVFFDRGLIDAAAGLQRVTGEPVLGALKSEHRFHRRVFLAPPWPEIYTADPERRHGLEEATVEYQHLLQVYPELGYEVVILPKVDVPRRADLVLASLTRARSKHRCQSTIPGASDD